MRLTLISIEDLEKKLANVSQRFELTLSDQAQVAQVQDILKAAAVGRSTIQMKVPVGNGKQVRLALPGKYRLTAEVCATLTTIRGLVLEELDDEKAAWQAFQDYAKSKPDSHSILGLTNLYSEGKISLSDYIEIRKK